LIPCCHAGAELPNARVLEKKRGGKRGKNTIRQAPYHPCARNWREKEEIEKEEREGENNLILSPPAIPIPDLTAPARKGDNEEKSKSKTAN